MQEQLDKVLEFLEKLNPKQKWGGLAAIIIVLCGAFYYFVAMDLSGKIAKAEKEYSKLNAERIEKESYAKNLALYEAKFNELQGKLKRAQNLLPDSDEVPGLLSSLSGLGETVGLTIERFVPKNEELFSFYAAIPFNLTVHGNYHDIAMYIDAISRLDRIVNVSNIEMSSPKVVNKKIVLDSQFVITTYRFLKEGESAEADNGKGKKGKKGKGKDKGKGGKK